MFAKTPTAKRHKLPSTLPAPQATCATAPEGQKWADWRDGSSHHDLHIAMGQKETTGFGRFFLLPMVPWGTYFLKTHGHNMCFDRFSCAWMVSLFPRLGRLFCCTCQVGILTHLNASHFYFWRWEELQGRCVDAVLEKVSQARGWLSKPSGNPRGSLAKSFSVLRKAQLLRWSRLRLMFLMRWGSEKGREKSSCAAVVSPEALRRLWPADIYTTHEEVHLQQDVWLWRHRLQTAEVIRRLRGFQHPSRRLERMKLWAAEIKHTSTHTSTDWWMLFVSFKYIHPDIDQEIGPAESQWWCHDFCARLNFVMYFVLDVSDVQALRR